MTHLTFFSPKGGQGCSTVAAATAILLARQGPTLLVDRRDGDLAPVLGLPAPMDEDRTLRLVAPNLDLGYAGMGDTILRRTNTAPGAPEHTVYDAGTTIDTEGYEGELVMVVRPDYLALRRAMAIIGRWPDRVILIAEPGRALGLGDVESIMSGCPVTVVEHDIAVGRAVDAGLLLARLPKSLARGLDIEMVTSTPRTSSS